MLISVMFLVYYNVIFEHMYCTEPGNLIKNKNIVLKYQCFTMVEQKRAKRRLVKAESLHISNK